MMLFTEDGGELMVFHQSQKSKKTNKLFNKSCTTASHKSLRIAHKKSSFIAINEKSVIHLELFRKKR